MIFYAVSGGIKQLLLLRILFFHYCAYWRKWKLRFFINIDHMNLSLDGHIVIVTGGASGIGEMICKVLSAEGAIPCIIDRNKEAGIRVVNEIAAAGGQAHFAPADLTDATACQNAVQDVITKFGCINGLVNNAGLNDGVSLTKGTYDLFVNSLKTNVVHYYMMAHFALPALIQTKGAIVNISSKVAETGQGNTSGYAASNGIRNEMVESWALELNTYGIRVNAVIVAECMTPQYEWWINQDDDPQQRLNEINSRIPLENRMTTTKEIADMVTFLLSGKAAGINGELLHIDGGYVHLDRRLR